MLASPGERRLALSIWLRHWVAGAFLDECAGDFVSGARIVISALCSERLIRPGLEVVGQPRRRRLCERIKHS